LVQETDHPVGGWVRLTVTPERAERFTLRLRIPAWSRATAVRVNGQAQEGVRPGTYLRLDRTWKPGDKVELTFDMGPRLWVGEREAAGKVSVYHGPLLLAYDPRFDAYDPGWLPALATTHLAGAVKNRAPRDRDGEPRPLFLTRLATEDGRGIRLCDFASTGAAGNRYVSWLPARKLHPVPFSRENPGRWVWP
jgi:hypothetical protein